MTINVIHNPARKDRYALLMQEVREHNLEIKLWDSVHIYQKPKQNINLAHRNIIQWAKDNKLPMVCVAEDDFHIICKGAFEYFINNIPNDFDLFLSNIIWGRIAPDNTTSDFAGLNLYICHERYYNTFLESDPLRDIDRAQMRRGIFKVCDPFIAVQHETFSDNAKKIHTHEKLYRGRTLYAGQ